jgi:periplasmic protein TonB
MMNMKKSTGHSLSKMMLMISFVAGFFFSFTGNAKAQETYNGEEIFVVAEEMPVFPGETKALYEAIAKNLKYPSTAKENGIEGKVMVRFIVDKDGAVKNPTVIKSVDAALDKAATDAVKLLPKFKPGKNGGQPVNVYYTVPIAFRLATN